MILKNVAITDFRNIKSAQMIPSQGFNFLWGENGSGKTSFLEAIYILGTAKSFRTRHVDRIIRYETNQFVLFSELQQDQLYLSVGIERTRAGEFNVRIDRKNCQKSAELASLLPIQLINPDSYKLIEAGPSRRRQFIDWGLFHVEHSFQGLWAKGQHILKQRNAIIRQKTDVSQLNLWSSQLVEVVEQIDQQRLAYLSQLFPVAQRLLEVLQFDYQVDFQYYRGWDKKKTYLQALEESTERDFQLGYTQYGFQRADLHLYIDGRAAQDVLSRGEQKLLVCALSLAQGQLLKEITNRHCLYLIDDLMSELDEKNSQFLLQTLSTLGSQVFITGVELARFQAIACDFPIKLFHVEHGVFSESNISFLCEKIA